MLPFRRLSTRVDLKNTVLIYVFFLAWPTLSKAGMFGLGKPEHIARTCKYATICVYVIYRIRSYFYALEAECTGLFGIITRYALLDHFTMISSLPRPPGTAESRESGGRRGISASKFILFLFSRQGNLNKKRMDFECYVISNGRSHIER